MSVAKAEADEQPHWWRDAPGWRQFCKELYALVQHLPVDIQLATFDVLALTFALEESAEMRNEPLICAVHGERRRQPTLCPICALVECRLRFRATSAPSVGRAV